MESVSKILPAHVDYQGIKKVQNIAENCDEGGLKNIVRYLDGDYRIIYDNRVICDELEKQMKKAYLIVEQLRSKSEEG
ncbi:hypothetical protein IT774_10220 [Salinimonas marina]|uniref:Uncharacterized protein n=1 Tax=Salinimonas marina TaxID=2785918 RepID=A0A7S9HC01_9ALTE|nr:hypothetical protein [Salinimonas marina]QPG04609.1 hypothetical protein IT774_10220 [Salinimonas marina]